MPCGLRVESRDYSTYVSSRQVPHDFIRREAAVGAHGVVRPTTSRGEFSFVTTLCAAQFRSARAAARVTVNTRVRFEGVLAGADVFNTRSTSRCLDFNRRYCGFEL